MEFVFDGSLEDRDEIYSIRITADRIRVSFRDRRGAVNGAASIALLLKKRELKQGLVIDYPDCAYRSFLIDLARGLPDIEDVKRTVVYMALAKYNRLHLHLIDSKGPCFYSDALPEYRFVGNGAQYDKQVIRDLVEFCRSFAIEIVPEIEVPAHATEFLKVYPQFICQVENANTWVMCTGNDELWPMLSKLVGEVVELFPDSTYVHVGADELEFSDLEGASKRLCHWTECPRCAALRRREGLADRQAQFYYVMERMHEIVTAHGRKMIMWNDQVDVSKPVPISRDILMQFWRIAYPGRGPVEGCSMEKLLGMGFRAINSVYQDTYIDIDHYASAEKLKTWVPYHTPERALVDRGSIVGGEMCAWEFGNIAVYPFYGYVTPPALAIFGDKLWNVGEREYTADYLAALCEFVFGASCENDIFACFGSPIPPRKKDQVTYLSPSEISADRIFACIEELSQKKRGFYTAVIDEYIRLLKIIAEDQGGLR